MASAILFFNLGMSKILIKRNSEWANRTRPIQLFINGKEFMEIKHQQLVSIDLPAGEYRLSAKLGWGRSRTLFLNIEKEETRRIEIKGFLLSEYFLPLAVISFTLYLGNLILFNKNSLVMGFIIMLLFGYWLYFTTIGRRDYIRLIERS